MFTTRKKIFSRILCVLMALHIFNLSIDTPDTLPDTFAEDLGVNDIESVTELVLENILEINNAIPESDEQDNEDGSTLDIKKVEFYTQKVNKISLNQSATKPLCTFALYQNTFLNKTYSEITTPPPEA